MNAEALDVLHALVFAVHPLDDVSWQALSGAWTGLRVGRKQLLTRIGQTESYLYLVLDGVQRAYCTHEGREFTLVFTYAPSFSGVLDSLLLQQASRYHLETLTTSRLLRIHQRELFALMEAHRPIETWVRLALSQVLAGALQRQVELMSLSAGEKFSALLRRSPHLLQLVPHKYLASYIGLDATTFSKLMGSVRL
jgi:CRP-like cAMP-binding protein